MNGHLDNNNSAGFRKAESLLNREQDTLGYRDGE